MLSEIVSLAARNGNLKDLKVLLDNLPQEQVVRLVSTKIDGLTPLVISCKYGHLRVVEYLVDKCHASVEQLGTVEGNVLETLEAPPLWVAVAAYKWDIIKFLVKRGANVNSTTDNFSTPLLVACALGQNKVVKFLVKNKADIESANKDGQTCLMLACSRGKFKMAKYLIEMGANVNRKTDTGLRGKG